MKRPDNRALIPPYVKFGRVIAVSAVAAMFRMPGIQRFHFPDGAAIGSAFM